MYVIYFNNVYKSLKYLFIATFINIIYVNYIHILITVNIININYISSKAEWWTACRQNGIFFLQ